MRFFDLTGYMADMVYELVPGVRRQGHNQLNFRCPICGDGKKKTSRRGHFYLAEGTYYCWNAGCPAYEHGMSGLQFLSAVTGKTYTELKSELIKRAGTFNNITVKEQAKQNIEMSYHQTSIYTGIGTTGTGYRCWLSQDCLHGLFDAELDGYCIGLYLPTMILGAIVSKIKEITHFELVFFRILNKTN